MNGSHWDVWLQIRESYTEYSSFNPYHLPRGRVVYDSVNNTYICYMSKELINLSELKNNLLDKFSLTDKKVKFSLDRHYNNTEYEYLD